MDDRWTRGTGLTMASFTGTEWAGLVVAATGFLTMLGKGTWSVVRYVNDRRDAEKQAREAEVERTIEAKNKEIAELRQMVRDLSQERRQGRPR